MTKYKISINREYEIEAENEEEALAELENDFGRENTTAENQFWDSCEVEETDELKELVKEKIDKNVE